MARNDVHLPSYPFAVLSCTGSGLLAGLALIVGQPASLAAESGVLEQSILAAGHAGLHAALVLAAEGALRRFIPPQAARWRAAFLLSLVFGAVQVLLGWTSQPSGLVQSGFPPVPGWFGWSVLLGALLGGMTLTALNGGLWENNSPPSEAIRREVYERHQAVTGAPPPVPRLKRLFDVCAAAAGLVISLPIWFVSILFIWIEDPGPLLFVKNSVGRGGVNFHQYKFRTMVRQAENGTGPVASHEGDARILLFGRFLRRTALDELPQLLNILVGEMSFVGPRPQRTVLVHGYLQTMPEYAQRHTVLPGLAGLAQVAGDYYLTPRQKLRFDRLYIRYCSLGYDLKLLVLAFLITFYFRWIPGWRGRLPRPLLHSLKSRSPASTAANRPR